MLKLNAYEEESFPFYEDVVKSKQKKELKQSLASILDEQRTCFETYDTAFRRNDLETIEAAQYSNNQKANLKDLYSFRAKKMQQLKTFLKSHPTYRENILNICQNCTINEADGLDHILAETEYPEYSVHPKNLFPCCTTCNRKKSTNYVDENGSRLFLNLYLDQLPRSQYLYVEFGDNWLPTFRLVQPNNVSDDLFRIIDSHYRRLDLLNRFRDCSNEIISDLKFIIRRFEKDRVQNKIREICTDLEPFLGYNHRKVVLYRALCNSEEFILECTN
jgi:5-methylcytosine-specific restriction endonuclease McrA